MLDTNRSPLPDMTDAYRQILEKSKKDKDRWQDDDGDGKWYVTTTSAISWLNVSMDNLPSGSEITVSSSSTPFYTSESLGSDNAGRMFTCKDIDDDFELIVESCDLDFSHSVLETDGLIEFKSIVAIILPTLILRESSSLISLFRADVKVSFSSTFPPGNSHIPLEDALKLLFAIRNKSFFLITAATTSIFALCIDIL